jgi:acyl dehydratase
LQRNRTFYQALIPVILIREIQNGDATKSSIGEAIAVSDRIKIEQDRTNQFADATGDHQWIQLDWVRAKLESPFRSTIAHGFLTLSMLPMLLQNALRLRYVKMTLKDDAQQSEVPRTSAR